jgi:hypothetical protein
MRHGTAPWASRGRFRLPSRGDWNPREGRGRSPGKKQLMPESLKVIEDLEKRGCKINWTE